MRKIPIALASAALCSFAAFAAIPTAYAAEDGTPEKAAELARTYLNEQETSGDEQAYLAKQPYHVGNWCVRFAMYCITQAGGKVTGVSSEEASTTSAIVNMYAADPDSYHSWVGEYWSYSGKENPKVGYTDDDYTPQVGDLVFFDNGPDGVEVGPGPDHTGLVVEVEGTGKDAIVTTIEGNITYHIVTAKYQNGRPISGEVDSCTEIVGFGTPKYPNKSTSSNPSGSSDNTIPESLIVSELNSRQRALEQACMRMDKSRRNSGYSHTTIAFVDEVLQAAGARSFYKLPEEPHITDFVKDYKANGAFFEYSSSSYVPRVGDVVVLENNGDASDGADQLGIVSGANFEGGKKEVYIIKYDPSTDRVCDSALCTDTIVGYCTPFYEYDDLGDVTYDGQTDASDAEKIMEFISADKTDISAYIKLCADVNKNGTVNRLDISELQQKLSKQLLLEPETDQQSQTGKRESDRITAAVTDEKGYMVYGPYIKGLAEGDKVVTFRMKTDNNTADNDRVARIEVNDPDLGAIIASKDINRKDFLTPDAFQDFRLEYENSEIANRVEYRVYYFQKALISVDCVTVKDVDAKTNMVFEAETDLSSRIREKEDGKYGKDGIEARVGDKQDFLAYGPYVDNLALGSFRADFSLKVDNNTIDGDVLRIEVYNRTKDKVIAQRTLKCTDFEQSNFTQVFPLCFNNGQLNDVYEFRAVYLGNSETIIDKVTVSHLGKKLANGFGPESMTAKEGCKKEDNAVILSKEGDIVYGPYTDKVSLGSNTAMFKAAITGEGAADDVVAVFDVFTSTNDNFFVKKEIKRSEISSDGYYRFRFDLPAEYADSKLEFRVTATGKADIRFEKVIITKNKDTVPGKVTTSDIDPSMLNTTSRKVLMSGVDVSNPGQHRNIDWDVLNDNVDFVIIRAGDPDGDWLDESFEYNYSEARRLGMNVGAYWFARCTTVEEAEYEAGRCIEYLKGKNFEFPVYMDVEAKDVLAAEDLDDIIVAFCEKIKAAGYTPGLYASLDPLRNCIGSSIQQKYALWVAQYNYAFDYEGAAGMWQYSKTGRVDGISVDVDLDYCYVDYPSIIGK